MTHTQTCKRGETHFSACSGVKKHHKTSASMPLNQLRACASTQIVAAAAPTLGIDGMHTGKMDAHLHFLEGSRGVNRQERGVSDTQGCPRAELIMCVRRRPKTSRALHA